MSETDIPNTGPRKVCVIGWPVEHSRSPTIHNTWLKRHGIEGEYTKLAVKPEELLDTLRYLPNLGFRGANVTVPHKEAAFEALQPFVDAPAERLQAVNTMYRDPDTGDIRGTNTDGAGFWTHLKQSVPGFNGKTAVVLGAGGAARAIVDVLETEGRMKVRLVNRTVARAASMVADIEAKATVYGWEQLPAALEGADLLVNTTTLGMEGQAPLEIDLAPLPDHAVVYDIVYVPLETPLLAQARARGLAVVDGLGMLLWQAAPGFAKWFGVEVDAEDVAAARALIEADLKNTGLKNRENN
ncbi:shikimate dehydrogenase [Pyruvatibacter sp. HU-CL02332]|uniref:shikimate dehydrogenase n=1 Tax=Pyruvatibacter sp. HU-CL02332 TaxID=3127650 RepID=UPI00310C4829